jgi:protein O-mannosyl-transferase
LNPFRFVAGSLHLQAPGRENAPGRCRPVRGATIDTKEPRQGARLALLIAPALLGLLIHAGTLRNTYPFDDVRVLASVEGPAPAVSPFPWWFRAVAGLSHRLDGVIWDGWTPGPHLTNLFLHALACAVAIALALTLSRSRCVALLTGLLFAVHPVHVEVVASIENRKDALAMIFDGLAILVWIRVHRPALRYSATALLLVLGVLSKEIAAIGTLFILFLVDLLGLPEGGEETGEGNSRLRWKKALPLLLLCAVASIAAVMAFQGRFIPSAIYETTGGQLRSYPVVLANSAAAIPQDIRLLVWPVRLSADYPPPAGLEGSIGAAAIGIALLAVWIGAAIFLARRKPLAGFALLWPPVMLAASSNLIPLTEFFVADRYLYAPSFGACLAAALLVDSMVNLSKRDGSEKAQPAFHTAGAPMGPRLAAGIILIAALALSAGRCIARCRDWRDSFSLWSAAQAAGCETFRVNHNLGVELVRRGRLEEGIGLLRKATEILPARLVSRRALAAALIDAGRPGEAQQACRFVLQVFPNDPGCTFLELEAKRRLAAPQAVRISAPPLRSALVGLAEAIERCSGKDPADCAAAIREEAAQDHP